MTKVRWGILATGSIAGAFADGLQQSRTGVLAAVASRSIDKARTFASRYPSVSAHGSYESLLADQSVDAIYVATPHPQHAEWAIKAARAGKHVLCEKPIALNHADAMLIADAAAEHGVVLMEAFMYRCHPATAKLVELISNGAIGKVCIINATFSYQAGFDEASRVFNNDLAGGGILDVGCYPVSISRLIAGAAVGIPFDNPTAVSGAGRLGRSGVDEWAVGTLKFSSGIVVQIATGVAVEQENIVRIFGTEGSITVVNPYLYSRKNGETGTLIIRRAGAAMPEEIAVRTSETSYAFEADAIGDAILQSRPRHPAFVKSPAPSMEDTLGNMQTLDAWRTAIGLEYDQEKPAHYRKTTAAGVPLARQSDAAIPTAAIEGLANPVSRLVMGCDNQRTFPHAVAMFDHFFELGGNTFDTAHIYAGGLQERLLGDWHTLRGVRPHINLIVKGGHTPFCTPAHVVTQLGASLDRLQTDYADLYLIHRDNRDVPVGEFMDCFNALQRDGKVRRFGVSNWSIERIIEANEYAKRHGIDRIAVVSNQFSLARMIAPPWPGCESANTPSAIQWHIETQTPLLPWSSQARGFFLPGRAAVDKQDDPELVKCWYSEDNFKRLARAKEIAAKHGVEPIHIALAFVLQQPFPTFALIGPRTIAETRSSLRSLALQLTAEEMTYLDLQ